ncbi:hypothetical protein H1R20_g13228, partial [Candolleomyces eurysporus]
MAENRSPPPSGDIPKLNLANLASPSKRSRSKTPGIAEPKPMAGDRIFNVAGNNVFNTNAEGSGGLAVDVDTTRMQLISPPPEEMLILLSARKKNTPFTPSLLADEEGSMTTAKRKRQQQTPKPSRITTAESEVAPSTSKQPQWAEATPNPRLRKQARRSTEPEEVLEDVEMESPTRNAFISTMTTPIPLPSTPSRPSGKAKLKKVLLQSPHTANPDADYIPPVRLLTSPGPGGEEEEEEADELGPITMGSVVRRKLLAAKGSRRSATPIPAYEPPKDVFTPPREVVMQPPPSTTRRLKGKGRQSSVAREAETAVKQEMPDIDLKAPMPPPSPGDDPLLLSSDIEEIECLPPPVVQHKTPKMSTKKKTKGDTGKKSTVKSSKKKAGRTPGSSKKTTLLQSTTSTAIAAEVVLQEEEEEGDELLNRGPLDFDLPPSSPPPASEDEDNFDWTQGGVVEDQYLASTEDSMMHMDPADAEVEPVAVGLLDFDSALKNHTSNSAAAGWSSDEEEGDQDQDAEGTGEYTGRWRLMKVRTKTDPPSEATAYRMEEWGRPVSPFPGVRRLHLDPEKDVVLPEESVEEPSTPRNEAVGLESTREEVETPRPELTILPPSEAEVEEEEAREEEEVMRMSIEPEEEEPEPQEQDHQDDDDDVQQEAEPEPFPVTPANNRAFEFTSSHYVPLNDVEQATQDVVNDDDDGNEEDLSDLDLGMVKIVSADPRAAARAAAILKQYDYECFTKLTMKQQRNKDKRRYSSLDDFSQESRRRNLLGSGVGKGDSREVAERERKRRRATLGMGVIGDRVVIPGSPSVTLPELLHQAEKEVLNHSPVKVSAVATPPLTRASLDAKRLFETPVRKEVSPTVVVFPVWNQTYEGEERPWTKEEWKVLDSCLTDERLDVRGGYSPHAQELKPVDEIDVDNVVERFVGMAGGDDVVNAYGSSWTRDLLRQRVRALQRKQRSGNVAPPTTPIAARSVSPALSLGGEKRRASMEVPDFTPLGRRAPPPRKSRPSLPQPVTENAPFSTLARRKSIPATLLAPRYSHLLDEARIISGEVADMSMQQDSQGGDTEEQPSEPDELPTAEPHDETSVEFPTVESTPQPSESRDLRYRTPGTTFGKKLKGIFFSYLPTKSRGPVETPERPPLPKVPHPKELVELHPAPLPKPSMIPRPKQPQRLVQLNPVQPPPPPPDVIPRPRRSSGSSVKDLVKSFEEMKDREQQERPPSSLGKAAGIRSLGKASKPSWKP